MTFSLEIRKQTRGGEKIFSKTKQGSDSRFFVWVSEEVGVIVVECK